MGCEWKGLFKDLIVSLLFYLLDMLSTILLQDQHLSSCQFITVECRNTGCGDRVLLAKLEDHLKNECLYRLVECKDCGEKMAYSDLNVSHKPVSIKLYSLIVFNSHRHMVTPALML